MSRLICFLGPSLSAERARALFRCEVRPPAGQGDVWRALEAKPRAIALIDGVFAQRPPVWHHELRSALDAGVTVFGAASMGALRAVELEPFGMIGVGQVFRRYRSGEWNDDADVALLHASAEHAHRPLTVPLVVMRDVAERCPALRGHQRRALRAAAGAQHYTARTWASVAAELPDVDWAAVHAWRRAEGDDLKARDALECLRTAAALVASGAPAALPRTTPLSSLARRERAGRTGGEDATRQALLAAVGAQLGLDADPARVLRRLPRSWPEDRRQSVARVLALDEAALRAPRQLIADAPGPGEAAWLQAPRRRRRR